MPIDPRLTVSTLKVLQALLAQGELSGVGVAQATHLKSGTLYPVLARLEGCGWLRSHWEEQNSKDLGRPRRRFYNLTALGATRARAAFRDLTIGVEIAGAYAGYAT